MDHKQLIAWLVPVIARGIAWVLAAKLGMDAAESGDLSMQAAGAIGALALVGISIWTSIKGRSKLKGK